VSSSNSPSWCRASSIRSSDAAGVGPREAGRGPTPILDISTNSRAAYRLRRPRAERIISVATRNSLAKKRPYPPSGAPQLGRQPRKPAVRWRSKTQGTTNNRCYLAPRIDSSEPIQGVIPRYHLSVETIGHVLFVFCFERIRPKRHSAVWLYRAKPDSHGRSCSGWGPGGRRFKSCLPD
jgi:hypothetical protein